MGKLSIRISVLLTAVLFSCNPGQDGFTIQVHVDDVSDGTRFYLMNWRDNVILDSGYVSNGAFSLRGRLSKPEKLLLSATDSVTKEFIYTNLVIGNENVVVNAAKNDFPWNIDATGSENQDVTEGFNRVEYQRRELTKRIRADFEKLQSGNKDTKQLDSRVKEVSDSLDKIQVELIKRNFNSYAALFIFKYYKGRFSSAELAGLYENLSPELKQSIEGKAIKTQIEYPAPKVGDSYYDYTALNQNGDTVSLSDLNNKYILLHFAAAGCYYSQQSLRELRDVYRRYGDKLEIVRISEDVNREVWEKSAKLDSIPWVNLWDGMGEYGDAVVKYGTLGTPNYILISPGKVIVAKWFGYRDGIIEEELVKNLGR